MGSQDCPVCEGTGWKPIVTDGVRSVVRCECQVRDRIQQLLAEARLPPRYEHCAIENFDVRKDKDSGQPNPALAAAKLFARRFVEEYPTDFGLLFVGPTGVGKTHLAVAVLRELMLHKGVPCLFYDYRKLLKDIWATYSPSVETSERRVLQPVLEIEILLIDELTNADSVNWVKETIQHIINSRYNEKKVTLITTTLGFTDPSARRDARAPSGELLVEVERSLNHVLGDTIRSRLYEMCKLLEMKSDDYRKSIKQAGYKFHVE